MPQNRCCWPWARERHIDMEWSADTHIIRLALLVEWEGGGLPHHYQLSLSAPWHVLKQSACLIASKGLMPLPQHLSDGVIVGFFWILSELAILRSHLLHHWRKRKQDLHFSFKLFVNLLLLLNRYAQSIATPWMPRFQVWPFLADLKHTAFRWCTTHCTTFKHAENLTHKTSATSIWLI